ncbi:MAG: sulfotransferase [Sphingobium sp.]
MAELVVDQLIEQARKATGLERFDSDSFREGLEIIVADYNALGTPDELKARFAGVMLQNLEGRLKTTAYLETRPDLLDRPVERPVFVFGIPRTGTTLLSNLLACDPARRSPLTWEIDDPVPPATSATLKTDPRAIARLEQEKAMLAANPSMGKYYRNSAIYPNECIFFMSHDFKALALESRGKLPNYRDWLFSTDMTSAYAYHKRFLQILQAEAPGTWNLKMPSHSLYLEYLKAAYPDARLVWTHRDPFTAMGSFCSIISLSHMGFMGRIDHEWLGENCQYQAYEHADRIMDYRDRHGEESIIDVHYADLMSNPIESMRSLYKALDDDFTPEAEKAMRDWLDANPQGKFGKHEYKLEQYGLTLDQLRKGFDRYLSRYDVAREG